MAHIPPSEEEEESSEIGTSRTYNYNLIEAMEVLRWDDMSSL